MLSQQMAITRERAWWFLGGLGLMSTGMIVGALRGKNVSVLAGPLTAVSLVTAYQFDFAYGSKPQRIREMHEEILNDPKYWFNPVPESSILFDKKELD